MRSKRSWKPPKKSTDDRKSGKWGRDIFVRNQILDVLNSRSGSNAAINAELNLTFVYQCQWYRISACLHEGSAFSNLTWSNIVWCLLRSGWCFNGTKVCWLPLMHGNGCQQAFSCGTTIRALSPQPLGGWCSIAPNRAAVKCLTYEVGCTYPFPKISKVGSNSEHLMHAACSNGPSSPVGPELPTQL